MIAEARVQAVGGGDGRTRLAGLRSSAPLALRATPEALYLVGGAAGPVGGDRLRLDVDVGSGASLRIRSAAATVTLPGPGGAESRLDVVASVGDGGRLVWEPEPTVCAAGSAHVLTARVHLAVGGTVVWRDEAVLGRHGELPGTIRQRLLVDVGGRPLLRSDLALGTGTVDGPAITAGARAVGSVVVAGPDVAADPQPLVLGAAAAVLPLAGRAFQVTALARSPTELRALLERGLAAAGWPFGGGQSQS